jgi:hypothetical protein
MMSMLGSALRRAAIGTVTGVDSNSKNSAKKVSKYVEKSSQRHRLIIRVTRLGEFLPNGRLFALGSFFENHKVAQFFMLLFPKYVLCNNLDKNWFRLHFGRFFTNSSGADFSYIFSGENSAENFAENFPQKMLGKNGIFRGKSFEKSFFQEIPRNFPQKVIFRGKNVRKIGPWSPCT